MTAVAIVFAFVCLMGLAVVAVRFARYQAVHKYTDHDIASVREQTRKLSAASRAGLSIEHLAPLSPGFTYNPRDARQLGNPVDYIVFDGLDEGELRDIVIVEVKSGKRPRLSTRERQVRDAVAARRVRYEVFEWLEQTPEMTPTGAGEAPPTRGRAGGLETIQLPRRGRRRSTRSGAN